jgi:NitT/TauT family transport system permease protein
VLLAVASMIWVPIGVGVGLRPHLAEKIQPLAQFLAAFPANLLFPVLLVAIVHFALNPDIWLSPLIILGTQWYILFNVDAGATAYPNDSRHRDRLGPLRGTLCISGPVRNVRLRRSRGATHWRRFVRRARRFLMNLMD